MTTVDASIPLQVQAPQFQSPMQAQAQLMNLRDLQAQSQIRQQQAQQGMMNLATQQKMSQWASQPGNVDKLTGQATDQGMQTLSQFAPPELMQKVAIARQEFDKKNSDISKEAEQIKQAKMKQGLEKDKWIQENVREPSLIAYKEALKNGMTEQAAKAAGQREFDNGLAMVKKNGFFSEEEVGQFNTEFDPARVASRSQSFKEYSAAAEKTLADERADKAAKERERHDMATEGAAARREDRLIGALVAKNQPTITPEQAKLSGEDFIKTVKPSMANTIKAIAEGRQTFASMGIRGPEREKLVNMVNQYDPTYDEADAKSRYKSMNDFTTGKNGNTVRSLNVSIDHLGTLQHAADALKNGNVQMFNQFGNAIASATGQPAPTDFNATKKIVADEIVKGVVGSGGGVSDREEAAKSIAAVKSPAQLAGVINRYKDLLGGQLHGLKKQYEATTKRTDFEDRFLTPEARTQLGGREKKKGETVPNPMQAYPTATNPQTGERMQYKDGKWQPMQ